MMEPTFVSAEAVLIQVEQATGQSSGRPARVVQPVPCPIGKNEQVGQLD